VVVVGDGPPSGERGGRGWRDKHQADSGGMYIIHLYTQPMAIFYGCPFFACTKKLTTIVDMKN
jgi:hypothetical protein